MDSEIEKIKDDIYLDGEAWVKQDLEPSILRNSKHLSFSDFRVDTGLVWMVISDLS